MGAFYITTNDGKTIRMRSEELNELVAMPILDKLHAREIDREGAISMAVLMLEGFPMGGPQDPATKRRNAEEYLFPEEFDHSPY